MSLSPEQNVMQVDNLPKIPPIEYTKFVELKRRLDNDFVGYDMTKLALILGLVTGKPTLLIGDPGTSKTTMIRTISNAIEGVKPNEFFYALMNPYTREEELFGSVDIKKLTTEGIPERIIEGFLPGAKIIFLDEIFKAPNELRTTLFNALNEKQVRFGRQAINLPWIAFYSASNEVDLSEKTTVPFVDRFRIINFLVSPGLNKRMIDNDSAKMLKDIIVKGLQFAVKSYSSSNANNGKLLNEDKVRELQKYVLNKAYNNALVEGGRSKGGNGDDSLLREFVSVLLKMLPRDLGEYETFYKSIDENVIYLSPRRVIDIYTIANALAYLTNDDAPHMIHKALAMILGVPVGYPVYIDLLNNLKEKIPDWLNEYVTSVILSTTSGAVQQVNTKELEQLQKKAKEMTQKLGVYNEFIKALEQKLADQNLVDELAKAYAYIIRIQYATNPIFFATFFLKKYKEALDKGKQDIDALKEAIESTLKKISQAKNTNNEEVLKRWLAYSLYVLLRLTPNNVWTVARANSMESKGDTPEEIFAKVEQVLGTDANAKKIVEDFLSDWKNVVNLGNARSVVEELKQKASQQRPVTVDKSLEEKIKAIDEFIIKPLLWAYGYDNPNDTVFNSIKNAEQKLMGLTENANNTAMKEIAEVVDNGLKKIEELKQEMDRLTNEVNTLVNLTNKYENENKSGKRQTKVPTK